MHPLAIPEFRWYAALRFFIATGWHMQALVVSWFLYSLTKDPLTIGFVGLAEAIPAIGLALPMGYVVEKMNKRTSLIVSSSVIVFSAICTCIVLQEGVYTALPTNTVQMLLLAMIILNGAGRSMYSPSMFTTLSQIVPRDGISKATATSSTIWQTAMIGGPMLGGLLYGTAGAPVTSFICVCSMLVGVVAACMLKSKPPIDTAKSTTMFADLTQGIEFIFSKPMILGALSLDLFAVLFGGVVALLPVFAATILHVDEGGLGFLRSSMSIGSVIMMSVLSMYPPKKHAGRTMLFAVAGFGLCMLAFASSTNFYLSVAILMLAGAFDSVSVVVRHTILQLYTPEEMKGRVAAANTMFISSSNEIGAVESGVAARYFGTVPSVYFGGAVTLLVVCFVAWRVPALRKMNL